MARTVVVVSAGWQYEQALSIRKRVFVEEQKVPAELEIDEYEKESVHFLYLDDDVPVATGRLRLKGALVKFERIATLPEYRGKSYGIELMRSMQEYAAKHYFDCLPYMHAQTSAVGFYKKLSWTQIGSSFSEAGIDHAAMAYLPDEIDSGLRQRLRAMQDLPSPVRQYIESTGPLD